MLMNTITSMAKRCHRPSDRHIQITDVGAEKLYELPKTYGLLVRAHFRIV